MFTIKPDIVSNYHNVKTECVRGECIYKQK